MAARTVSSSRADVTATAGSRGAAVRAGRKPPPEWHTYAYGFAALAAGLLTLVADGRSPLIIAGVLAALVPWALLASGVALPLGLFILLTLVPVGIVSVVESAGGVMFFNMLMVARVTSLTRNRWLLAAAIVPSVALPLICWVRAGDPSEGDAGWVYFAAGVGLSWFCGTLARRQSELLAQIEAAQAQLADYTRAEERRRIARDIHDIVAHSLTVVLLNVSGARRAMAKDPVAADAALDRAEQVGRESLDGIRDVVGLLRDPDAATDATRPLPAATGIPALVAGYRDAGLAVDLSVAGALDRLDVTQGTTLYRFVQEALANARNHAGTARVDVSVEVTSNEARATVANALPFVAGPRKGAREGLGLVGMRERFTAIGGSMTAGPEGGRWVVSCHLPLASTCRWTRAPA